MCVFSHKASCQGLPGTGFPRGSCYLAISPPAGGAASPVLNPGMESNLPGSEHLDETFVKQHLLHKVGTVHSAVIFWIETLGG